MESCNLLKPEINNNNNNNKSSCDLDAKQRRSASYHPTIWETQRIESFVSPYSYKLHDVRLEELKNIVKRSLKTTKDHRSLLNLIDSIQRLGVAYHFEQEIEDSVSVVYDQIVDDDDLYTTALKFRILREHGRPISTDVFKKFRGEDGGFLNGLSNDVRGLLSLYEASHLGMCDEDVLVEAKNFTATRLSKYCGSNETYLGKQVQQSLEEVAVYWRMPRLEALNFIHLYQLDHQNDPNLLELAKLDYNLVQSVYQDELKELARWWRELGFKENLEFARDRLMENYLWVMGIVYEPHLSKCRLYLTKFVCILTVIDDIYDVYGSLDELEIFTNAVQRWDIEAMMELPHYMKVCYLGMLNFGNDIIYDVLKNHGLDVSSYIKEEWLSLCRSYMVEARWYNSEYRPSLDEYLQNACTSVGGHAGIVHACILQLGSTKNSHIECCFDNMGSKLIHCSSLIARLSDDLGTSKDEIQRGDVSKSVECYMLDKGTFEQEAISGVKQLISESWKMMNQQVINYSNSNSNNGLAKSMVRMCLNMARTAQCIFQHGDGIGTSTGLTKNRLTSLIVNPIPF